MLWYYTIGIIILACFAVSTLGTKLVLGCLTRQDIVDRPNARSNHKIPTPVGGGIGVLITLIPALLLINIYTSHDITAHYQVILGMVALAFVSWLDDIRHLPQLLRLIIQCLVVALALSGFEDAVISNILPFWADRIIALLLWVWFINLFNFMDGIDGITGAETIAICIGVFGISFITYLPEGINFYAVAIIGIVLGFLVWNWHPARIFMGDVGSIPLGFLIGWLLLMLSSQGFQAAALILPAYYLADSGLTLLKRLLRGEKIWEAHSQHFYQQAVRGGKTHGRVVLTISAANILLIVLALFSLTGGIISLVYVLFAGLIVAALLYMLGSAR